MLEAAVQALKINPDKYNIIFNNNTIPICLPAG
jgi:hypothetical protein